MSTNATFTLTSTSSNELTREFCEFARALGMFDEAAAVRKDGVDTADAIQASYDEGFTEGYRVSSQEHLAEKMQEAVNARTPFDKMLAHHAVMLTYERGATPFVFRPFFACKFGDVPIFMKEHELPQYQRELIGNQPDTVGVYGRNMLTNRPMFVVTFDHWTLCPIEPLTERAVRPEDNGQPLALVPKPE